MSLVPTVEPDLLWVCENCGHINERMVAYYADRAETLGQELDYFDTCDVCYRSVGNALEQPRAPVR